MQQALESPSAESITGRLMQHIEEHHSRLRQAPLNTDTSPQEIRQHLEATYSLDGPLPIQQVFEDVTGMLWKWSEHARNPMHFGLTRPTVDLASIVADTIAALYDPNLATWDFSPSANEIERFVLDRLASCFGYAPGEGVSHFTSGGQEANHTAVTVALTHLFPDFRCGGLRSLPGQPVLYLSQEGHHSFEKSVHSSGLGRSAIRRIAVGEDLKMKVGALLEQIEMDRRSGHLPFMVAATAGTTNAGAIDPLAELAEVARHYSMWFHADAAWGGAAALSERLRPLLDGIERADSVTFDAHKWLSVPVGAGAFFCRHRTAVEAAFSTDAEYVPEKSGSQRVYPYAASMQWSRRFIGLKVFMMLAVRGMPEIVRRIEHQSDLAQLMARLLTERGWRILNRPEMAVVCFSHARIEQGKVSAAQIVRRIKGSQTAWISHTLLAGKTVALRASVTNFETRRSDIERLVQALHQAVFEL